MQSFFFVLCSCGCRVLILERRYQETCMFCLLCLVAVAELRHLEMVCARLYPVIFVNIKICKMDSCGWQCACLIDV